MFSGKGEWERGEGEGEGLGTGEKGKGSGFKVQQFWFPVLGWSVEQKGER